MIRTEHKHNLTKCTSIHVSDVVNRNNPTPPIALIPEELYISGKKKKKKKKQLECKSTQDEVLNFKEKCEVRGHGKRFYFIS